VSTKLLLLLIGHMVTSWGEKTMIKLNSDELHAFAIGFFEVLCPWKPRCPMTAQAEFKPDREYHYYLAGRAAGFFSLMLIVLGLAILFLEVLS